LGLRVWGLGFDWYEETETYPENEQLEVISRILGILVLAVLHYTWGSKEVRSKARE
jgi:hypothetical protein